MEAARTTETSVDNYFTRQYIPQDKSELSNFSARYFERETFRAVSLFMLHRVVTRMHHKDGHLLQRKGSTWKPRLGQRRRLFSGARLFCISDLFIFNETWTQVKIYIFVRTSPGWNILLTTYYRYWLRTRSRVSSGSIVSDYGLDDRAIGVRSPAGAKDLSCNLCIQSTALGPTQPPVQWVPGVRSPGVKARPGRDADHSPPSSAEVVND
jgi:hypothetical protein